MRFPAIAHNVLYLQEYCHVWFSFDTFFISPFNLVERRASSVDIVHPYGIYGHLDSCFLQYRPSLTGLGGFVYRILHATEIEWGDGSMP